MILTIPDRLAHRVAVLNQWTWIMVQVIAPQAIRIGVSQGELSSTIGATADGINVNPGAGNVNDILQMWWKGELWALAPNATAAAPAQAVVVISGLERRTF